ncbi:hypothetical protein COCON_G00150070 [Conger conger]|uniref:tRNA (34-2'-O)-methyltransferase regulator WDR6 n=1 Tax=Conger conger TaxID=82655 RepID=A0A9Q1HWR9_CONCO|nr:hypothetical protein COCON_G00150070 [Conger conger]
MTDRRSDTEMESVMLVAPVTALEFLGEDYLLAGEGPVLSVYSLGVRPHACASLTALRNQRIHGVRPDPWQRSRAPCTALHEEEEEEEEGRPHGGAVRVVGFKESGDGAPCLQALGPIQELQDWVRDVRWLRGAAPLLAVALAHNAVLLLEAGTGRSSALRSCQEGCLLYSALLLGQRGVIFSLAYQRQRGWLASASDDRSVRMWGVGPLGGAAGCGAPAPACLRVLYGHQARVSPCASPPAGCSAGGRTGPVCSGTGRVGRCGDP